MLEHPLNWRTGLAPEPFGDVILAFVGVKERNMYVLVGCRTGGTGPARPENQVDFLLLKSMRI